MKFPRIKDYEVDSFVQLEIGLLVVCFLMHFLSWTTVTAGNETIYQLSPSSFGAVFLCMITAIFSLAILSKFVGHFSGFSLVVVLHMAILTYTAFLTTEKMKNIADFASGLRSTFISSDEVPAHLSVGGWGGVIAFVVFILAMFILVSWGVSAYRLATCHRHQLRKGYLWGLLAYFCTAAVGLFLMYTMADNFSSLIHGSGLETMTGTGYTLGLCGIIFFVMLFMLIVNLSVWLICELLRGTDKRKMQWTAFIACLLFLFCLVGVTQEKSELHLSFPHSVDDFVVMLGSYEGKWAAMTFAQLWFLLVAMTFLLRGIYFSRLKTAVADEDENSEMTPSEENTDNAEVTTADEEENESRRKYYYIAGGAAAVLAILIGIFTCSGLTGSGGNDLLPVEKPVWEKFVVITQDAPLYKDADTNSPKLAVTQEDLESDAIARVFKWSDVPDRRGWTSYDVTVSTDGVLPVVSEKDDWYLVSYDDTELGCAECYVQKSNCREVKPEPITPELLAGMTEYNYYRANFGLQTEGKYKNICFVSVMAEMEGCYVDVAVLTDGKLVNPMTRRIFTAWDKCTGTSFEVKDSQLQYREDMEQDGMLDARNIKTEADAELLFNLIPAETSRMQEVAYYFPEVSKEKLFVFIQNLGEASSDVISEKQDDPEDPEITQALNDFQDLIDRVHSTVEACEKSGEMTGNDICQEIEETRDGLNEKVNLMTEEQISHFEALCQKANDLIHYADSVNNTATVAEAVYSTLVEM